MLHKQNKISEVIGSFNLWPPLLHAFPPVSNLAVKVVITKFFLVFRQKLREALTSKQRNKLLGIIKVRCLLFADSLLIRL